MGAFVWYSLVEERYSFYILKCIMWAIYDWFWNMTSWYIIHVLFIWCSLDTILKMCRWFEISFEVYLVIYIVGILHYLCAYLYRQKCSTNIESVQIEFGSCLDNIRMLLKYRMYYPISYSSYIVNGSSQSTWCNLRRLYKSSLDMFVYDV